jgi:hypothetical protein
MTPAVAHSATRPPVHVPNRKVERAFFAAMILLLWGIVLWGFARTYFLAGMVTAPLPSWLVHVHGAAFTLWMVLLLVQSVLIVSGNLKVHRKLGMGGFLLAVAMVGLGLSAAVGAMRRGSSPPPTDPQTFFAVPVFGITVFAVLVYFAYKYRTKPEWHKRIILFATVAITGAAVGRLPIPWLQAQPPGQVLEPLGFFLMMVVFDLVWMRRVSKATLWPGLFVIAMHVAAFPVGMTGSWHVMTRAIVKA